MLITIGIILHSALNISCDASDSLTGFLFFGILRNGVRSVILQYISHRIEFVYYRRLSIGFVILMSLNCLILNNLRQLEFLFLFQVSPIIILSATVYRIYSASSFVHFLDGLRIHLNRIKTILTASRLVHRQRYIILFNFTQIVYRTLLEALDVEHFLYIIR